MAKMQKAHLASAGILALVFLSGVLLGLALDRGLEASPSADSGAVATEARPDEDHERRERRYMFERVGLSAEQQAVVDSIVKHHRERMRALRKEFSEAYDPRYWAIVDGTRDAIKQVMTPEQAAQYDSLIAENDRERRDEAGVLSRD